jgi:transcriptional regulator with XRE-family HTH domain
MDSEVSNEKLRYQRLIRGWSQKKVGELINTTKEMVSRWERGTSIPSPYYREKLCSLFGLTAHELGFILSSDKELQPIEGDLESSSEQNSMSDGLSQFSSIDETTPEVLEHFAALLKTCQKLSEGNELKTAESILWAYLPRVESIAKLSFTHQQVAANIASEGYLLAASLAGHRNDLEARHHLSEQALLYGKLAQNRDLQIAAMRQLAITFDYLGFPDKVLQLCKQMVPYLETVSPLLRVCIYADMAGAYTQMEQQQNALRFLGLAYEHFPEQYAHEPDFLHIICRYSTLALCDGLHHLHFGQPEASEKIFARIDGLQPQTTMPERVRIDVLNCQVEVFVALNDMEKACHYLEVAGQIATTIGSQRRLHESSVIFQDMQKVWRDEPGVKQLANLFHVKHH